VQQEECGPNWATISLMPGNGAGGLGAPASFQPLYDVAQLNRNPYAEWLAAARLDGDAHTDLITSGALLLNIPDAPNRAPTANAGPDRTTDPNGGPTVLQAQASDPDNDRLTFRWVDEDGRTVATCQQPDIFSPSPGEHTFTLIVRDDRGGIATDSVTVTDVSTRGIGVDIVRPDFDNPVPAFAPYVIQFRVVNPDSAPNADFDILVDRNGQNNFTPIPACTNLPLSATECVWEDPGPPSNDAALLFRFTSPDGRGSGTVARFQIVATPPGGMPAGWANGDVGAVAAAGAAGFDGHAFTVRGSGADIWNAADEFHWAFTNVTGNFEMTARVANVQNVNVWTKAGLMVRETQDPGSRHASIFATPGTQKPISFQRRPATNGLSVHTGGAIAAPPAWLMLRRTGDVIAAFYRTSATDEWTPLGTQTLTGLSSAVHVGLAMSSHVDGTLATATFDNVKIDQGAEGMEVLRPAAGERVQTNAPFVIRWLPSSGGGDIARYDVFFAQNQNGPWSLVNGCRAVPGDTRWCVWHRPSPVGTGFIRVVATTHTGSVRDAISHAFQIAAGVTGDAGMPPGWSCGDAGAVAAAGSCGYEVDDELIPDFRVNGSGADIWNAADEFSFARYAAYGDFTFTARVLFVENINRWTKAGIMIRDWDGNGAAPAGSRHASLLVTPTTEKGTAFQRRPVEGGLSVHTPGPVAVAPMWVKLVRSGDTIRAYSRVNALDAWTFVGEQTFSGLPYQVSAMLVVSSHVDGTVARARFEDVSIVDRLPMQSADIGTTAAGTTSLNGVETTIEGDGADIWNTADAFRFHYTKWRGNGVIVARVRSLENTNGWAKAGVMLRQSLEPGSPHVMAIVSAGRGLAMQSRSSRGSTSASTVPVPGQAPVWIQLRRFADTITASWSSDGETWRFLGQVEIFMGEEILVGLPVTSHAPGTLATAVFDDLLIWHRERF
jgi:regulation of enolase protein 1 (concanavalin A-like superfamily)